MLILTSHIGNRLRYALDVVFGPLGSEARCTTDREEFESYTGPKIAYTAEKLHGGAHIPCSGWLKDGASESPAFSLNESETIPRLCLPDSSGKSVFDLFSAVFFLASRFEEYQPFAGDALHRFQHTDGLTGKLNIHRRPLIDEWRMQLLDDLRAMYPSLGYRPVKAHTRLTIDVDSAFAFRHKGIKRTLGGFGKDLLGLRFSNAWQRALSLTGIKPDAYDTYDWVLRLCEQHSLRPTWFFLLADFGAYDKNVPHTSRALRTLITSLDRSGKVGIHPGMRSNSSPLILEKEISRLKDILDHSVSMSRQHYLWLKMPDTYRNLIRAGITEDHSMGYHSDIGFRLGTSFPIWWYDLNNEEITGLQLVPFCAMDTTLEKYLQLTPDEAIAQLNELKAITQRTGGHFTLLWHNESLCEKGKWAGWRAVLEQVLS